MGEINTRYAKKPSPSVPGVIGKDGKEGAQGVPGDAGAPGPAGPSGASAGVYVDLGSGTAFEIDWDAGDWFRIAPSGHFSIAFVNTPPAAVSRVLVIELVAANAKTLTLPGGGTWGGLGQPEFSVGLDLLGVAMRNGSSSSYWFLLHAGT